jgi:hypothetical protein
VDAGGKVHYSASYPGAGSQDGVDVPGYSTSLAGCSASIDQNGKVIVVDENGKPLSCQPLITKYVESRGQEYISACYPGDPSGAKTTLGWYTPSGSSTSN